MTNNDELAENADLKSIGLVLRKKREELSYTLEHVSEITRITLTCLRHIEEGDINALPGLVFVRGFIRNYAKLLGLESDWMIEALNQSYLAGGESSSATVVGSEATSISESEGKSKSNLLLYALGAGAICIIMIIVYVVYKVPSETLTTENRSVETVQAVASQEEIAESSPVVPQQKEEISAEKADPPPTAPPIVSPLILTLVAQANDWIRLAIDGQDAFELKLKKGEKYEWPAEEEYALIMTTGQTATIHLNGEEIVERETFLDQLYQVKLNKFTLKQINNQ